MNSKWIVPDKEQLFSSQMQRRGQSVPRKESKFIDACESILLEALSTEDKSCTN
jgi:hypothetical protein